MTTIETITLNPSKKIYFVSDFHLGAPNSKESISREKRIVKWLDEISKNAQTIFFLGDIFDFWFEYKHVIPKGFVRFFGKLAEMSDNGIDLRMFVGNHDLGIFDYFENEIGIKIYRKSQLIKINETLCFIGHGDAMGPSYRCNKLIKKVFECKFSQRLFALLHPTIGIGFANFCSRKSREKTGQNDAVFTSTEKEALIVFSNEYLKKNPTVTYFIFGHRHLPLEIKLSETTMFFNTGDWLNYDSFVELRMENGELRMKSGCKELQSQNKIKKNSE
jgi:UDP-2,3-diacylglucosamine hydrolase